MSGTIDPVMESYHRCRRDDSFVDTFYASFLAKSPRIAEKFEGTNFRIQKMMLRESLLEMLCFEQGADGAREEIEKLGRRHQDLKIEPDMYTMWLDSLCEAIRKHDPQIDDELEGRWRVAMQKGIDVMLSV